MKGFKSVLLDEGGEPLNESDEAAHLLTMVYSDIARKHLKETRQLRMWGYITLILGVGFVLLWIAYSRRPKACVTRIGKAYWVGALYNFGGAQVIVDKSHLVPSVEFRVPVPDRSPAEILEAKERAESLLADLPILAPRRAWGGNVPSGRGDPLSAFIQEVDVVRGGFERAQDQAVSLNALQAASPLAKAIGKGASADSVFGRNLLVAPESSAVAQRLAELQHLTELASQRTQVGKPVEDVARDVLGSLDRTTKSLEEIQERSLVKILQPLLTGLEHAYRAPMLIFYCRSCVEKTCRQLQLDLQFMARSLEMMALGAADAPEDAGNLVMLEKVWDDLGDSLSSFSAASRAAVLQLEFRKTDGRDMRVWRCRLCNKNRDIQHPADAASGIITAHRAKQELVLPLWDQLWIELSSERAGLLERADKEQRDNVQQEHRETVQAVDEFAAERREVKNRMEQLAASTLRAVETFSSLIDSFLEAALLGPAETEPSRLELEGYRKQYLAKLQRLDTTIETIENHLQEETEKSLHRRKPIQDFVDAVKASKQFTQLPPRNDARDIVVETELVAMPSSRAAG